MKRFLFAAAAGMLLSSCAPASTPKTAPPPLETPSGAPPAVEDALEMEEAFPEKFLPGCRADLFYPLKMTGESTATDFSRWTAMDIDGNQVTQEVLKGSRLTAVSVWASYCGSCLGDLAALQEIYDRYDRAELNVIGIIANSQNQDGSLNLGEGEVVKQIAAEAGADFLQLFPSDDLIQIRLKKVDVVPETFFLDSAGNQVGETIYGGYSAEELARAAEQAMKQLEEELS